MGHQSRIRLARQESIHRTKLFNGESAEAVHSKYAFPPKAKCRCGARPMTRIISMAPVSEALRRSPQLALAAELDPAEMMKSVVPIKTAGGMENFLRIGLLYVCKACTPAAEKAAAKLPSWVLVEINHGPGPDRPVVAVA